MSGPPPCFSAGDAPKLTPAVANDVRGPRRRTYRLLFSQRGSCRQQTTHIGALLKECELRVRARNVSLVGGVLCVVHTPSSNSQYTSRKLWASHKRLFHTASGIPATVRGEDQYNRQHYSDSSYQNCLMPRRMVFRGVGDPPCPDSSKATHSRCKNLAVAGLPHRVSSAS